jgi:GNAT superfamily N-acetyltransferase
MMTAVKQSFAKRIWTKIRYRLLMQEILDRLAGMGIRIQPYYLVLEGIFDGAIAHRETGFEEYKGGFLRPDEMKRISSIAERPVSEEELVKRIEAGQICFTIQCREQIVAYTWCNLAEYPWRGGRIPLKVNEAYLYDAYTLKAFRGRGIAPYMRYQCYKELAKLGRTRLYSITAFFNASSMKFKAKLNARPLELNLRVGLSKRWGFNLRLKKFDI